MWDIFDCKLCYRPVRLHPRFEYRLLSFLLLPYLLYCPVSAMSHLPNTICAFPDLQGLREDAQHIKNLIYFTNFSADLSMIFSRHKDAPSSNQDIGYLESRNTRVMIPVRVPNYHTVFQQLQQITMLIIRCFESLCLFI